MHEPVAAPRRLYSIGHSNQSIEAFLALLKANRIEVLVDVRSSPYSKYATHFDMRPLRDALAGAGVKYLFLGKELGGHPSEPEFYDAEGHVLYAQLAQSPRFLGGIERLERGAASHRVAIMCGEEDPAHCHRRMLVGRVLAARGVAIEHIRADGRTQTEDDLRREETGGQGDLFADQEEADPWMRSTQSVSPRKAPPNSSAP